MHQGVTYVNCQFNVKKDKIHIGDNVNTYDQIKIFTNTEQIYDGNKLSYEVMISLKR